MSLSPYFRSPFTDITPYLLSNQWFGRCADFEMSLMNCLEAYGLEKGRIKCEDLIKDFQECTLREKQRARSTAMLKERERQYASGERSEADRYQKITPRQDSY